MTKLTSLMIALALMAGVSVAVTSMDVLAQTPSTVDVDNDGIADNLDSDTNRDTDLDNNGIDDANEDDTDDDVPTQAPRTGFGTLGQ